MNNVSIMWRVISTCKIFKISDLDNLYLVFIRNLRLFKNSIGNNVEKNQRWYRITCAFAFSSDLLLALNGESVHAGILGDSSLVGDGKVYDESIAPPCANQTLTGHLQKTFASSEYSISRSRFDFVGILASGARKNRRKENPRGSR